MSVTNQTTNLFFPTVVLGSINGSFLGGYYEI